MTSDTITSHSSIWKLQLVTIIWHYYPLPSNDNTVILKNTLVYLHNLNMNIYSYSSLYTVCPLPHSPYAVHSRSSIPCGYTNFPCEDVILSQTILMFPFSILQLAQQWLYITWLCSGRCLFVVHFIHEVKCQAIRFLAGLFSSSWLTQLSYLWLQFVLKDESSTDT